MLRHLPDPQSQNYIFQCLRSDWMFDHTAKITTGYKMQILRHRIQITIKAHWMALQVHPRLLLVSIPPYNTSPSAYLWCTACMARTTMPRSYRGICETCFSQKATFSIFLFCEFLILQLLLLFFSQHPHSAGCLPVFHLELCKIASDTIPATYTGSIVWYSRGTWVSETADGTPI